MPPTRPAGKNAKETIQVLSWVADWKPHLSSKASRCIALGSLIENLYGAILTSMLGANAKPAAAMYKSLQSLNAQSAVVLAAAEAVLSDDELDVLSAVTSLCNRAMKHRHRFAHWVWGHSKGYPEAIILIDPKALLEYELETAVTQGNNDNRGLQTNFDPSSCLIYDEAALVEAVNELKSAEENLARFRFAVLPFSRQLSRVAGAYQPLREIAEQPDVKLELQRWAEKRQKNPEAQPPRPRRGRRG